MEEAHTGQSSFLRKQLVGASTKAALPEHPSFFELCLDLSLQTDFMSTSAPGGAVGETLVVNIFCTLST